jgi:hypothetical protein
MRMLLGTSVAIAVGLALAGCTVTKTPTVSTTTDTPSISAPSAHSSVTASAPSPSASSATLPDATSAVDAGKWDYASFVSPSGTIVCGMYAEGARCDLPEGFAGKVPTSAEACSEANLDVTSVSVGDTANYACAGDPAGFATVGTDETKWWAKTGFGSVTVDGKKLATLPYGKKLKFGDFVCLSQSDGVTCANTKKLIGFKLAKAGVIFYR